MLVLLPPTPLILLTPPTNLRNSFLLTPLGVCGKVVDGVNIEDVGGGEVVIFIDDDMRDIDELGVDDIIALTTLLLTPLLMLLLVNPDFLRVVENELRALFVAGEIV